MRNIISLIALSFVASSLAACAQTDSGEETSTIEPVASEPQAAGGDTIIWKSNWKGASANANWWNELGSGYVDVWENSGNNGSFASMSYSRSSADPTSWKCAQEEYCYYEKPIDPVQPPPPPVCEVREVCRYTRYVWTYGWGEISANDFRASGKSAALAVDLSQYPNTWSETCTWDTETYTGSCSYGPATGTFELNWKGDGKSSNFSSGVNRSDYGKYSFRSTGIYRSSSAAVSGAAFGSEVEAWGWMSKNSGTSISKDVILAPKP